MLGGWVGETPNKGGTSCEAASGQEKLPQERGNGVEFKLKWVILGKRDSARSARTGRGEGTQRTVSVEPESADRGCLLGHTVPDGGKRPLLTTT